MPDVGPEVIYICHETVHNVAEPDWTEPTLSHAPEFAAYLLDACFVRCSQCLSYQPVAGVSHLPPASRLAPGSEKHPEHRQHMPVAPLQHPTMVYGDTFCTVEPVRDEGADTPVSVRTDRQGKCLPPAGAGLLSFEHDRVEKIRPVTHDRPQGHVVKYPGAVLECKPQAVNYQHQVRLCRQRHRRRLLYQPMKRLPDPPIQGVARTATTLAQSLGRFATNKNHLRQ